MVFSFTDSGLNFFESATVDKSYSETINTIAVGDGTSSPNNTDTSLDNFLYENNTSAPTITIERGSTLGEIRAVIELTGGSEVPSDSNITEFGFKASDGTLVYREVRPSSINVASGETKIVEIQMFVSDTDTESEQTITDNGVEFIADRAIGRSTDYMNKIAVGDGERNVSPSNTSLQNELYRNDESGSNTILETTANVGEVRAEITISAGNDASDEVAINSSISEFGLVTNGGTLVLHETRAGVILEQNDSKTFKIPFSIIQ